MKVKSRIKSPKVKKNSKSASRGPVKSQGNSGSKGGKTRHLSRGLRRKYLDERLQSLHQRIGIIERELYKLEARFYRICIFGSARIKPNSPIYSDVKELATLLARQGIDILTGGGPGLMEAANDGAQKGKRDKGSKSLSYGISIELEWEPVPNPHLDVKRHHQKFSSRLDDFMRLSHAVVVTPGGIGTVLELMFAWQLVQVKHLKPRPIVLMGENFWQGIIDWMREYPLKRGLVGLKDFDHICIVDSPREVFDIIARHHKEFQKNRPILEELSRSY